MFTKDLFKDVCSSFILNNRIGHKIVFSCNRILYKQGWVKQLLHMPHAWISQTFSLAALKFLTLFLVLRNSSMMCLWFTQLLESVCVCVFWQVWEDSVVISEYVFKPALCLSPPPGLWWHRYWISYYSSIGQESVFFSSLLCLCCSDHFYHATFQFTDFYPLCPSIQLLTNPLRFSYQLFYF